MLDRNTETNNVTEMPQRMALESMDVAEEKREQLKHLLYKEFPEVFNEDKVDFEQLQRVLGETIDTGRERYGLTWPGKADCMKVIQEPSRATLKPCREESVNFDNTDNLFIEGDNLEVLKLLQKSYFGKVKMIYIDPPYNTGKEFIYPDNYQETIETYMAYAGLVDDEGKKFSTNTTTEGRFHSKWLNMMYPRLYLAKNLLQEDGVIFISIDENEVENLRRICHEIFGEENFYSSFVWKRRSGAMDAVDNVSTDHEYVLCYGKSRDRLKGVARTFEKYTNPDNDSRGEWISDNLSAGKPGGDTYYAITDPKTGSEFLPPRGRYWPYSRGTMAKKIEEGRVIFPSLASGSPMLKRFKSEAKSLHMPISTWGEYKTDASSTAFITAMNTSGTKEIKDLFGDKVFTFPKPTRVIQSLAEQAGLNDSDIVLDFFSGSCSTAHAIMNESIQKNIKPKFIMVQLPEPCADDTPAFKMGFSNIADIGKERIRRAASKIASETTDIELLDLGFRVYKLGKSHFDQWQSEVEPGNIEQLQANLELHSNHIAEDVEQEALLYELLLKAGFELTESIEQQPFGNQTAFSIAEGALLICLEDRIEPETVEAMVKAEPAEIIVKDSAFAGNDQLKVNAVQTVKAYNQNSETDVVFKVV